LDTAIIVGVMIGSVVAIALVFGKTVLSVAWTGNDTKRLPEIRTKLCKSTYKKRMIPQE
jgi:hypothetical protein